MVAPHVPTATRHSKVLRATRRRRGKSRRSRGGGVTMVVLKGNVKEGIGEGGDDEEQQFDKEDRHDICCNCHLRGRVRDDLVKVVDANSF
jgi:hypothetical protein